MSIFLEELFLLMSGICNNTLEKVIVCGDFNVHFETFNKSSRDLQDLLLQLGLQQQVGDVTRNQGHMLRLEFC